MRNWACLCSLTTPFTALPALKAPRAPRLPWVVRGGSHLKPLGINAQAVGPSAFFTTVRYSRTEGFDLDQLRAGEVRANRFAQASRADWKTIARRAGGTMSLAGRGNHHVAGRVGSDGQHWSIVSRAGSRRMQSGQFCSAQAGRQKGASPAEQVGAHSGGQQEGGRAAGSTKSAMKRAVKEWTERSRGRMTNGGPWEAGIISGRRMNDRAQRRC
jgi:hypothetical protein